MEYFWCWNPDDEWPPEAVSAPEDFTGEARLNIACTQTELPAAAQRKIVRAWCELLPTLRGVEYLWFSSRVPQDLFDAACAVPKLKGLYIKWSGIKTLDAVEAATSLRCLHLGDSAGLRSIDTLGSMTRLRWLGLRNIKRITRLDPLVTLQRLEGLAVEGGTWTTQRVDSLAPIGELASLKYLSILNLRSRDKTLAPLFTLGGLQAFHSARWWKPEEIDELRRRNRRLVV